MKILKSKGFFIKSFLLHFLLSIIVVILSWGFLEPFAYNFMMKYFGATRQGSDNIVIIAIDDKSMSYHRWPWPREYYGEIMDYLMQSLKSLDLMLLFKIKILTTEILTAFFIIM